MNSRFLVLFVVVFVWLVSNGYEDHCVAQDRPNIVLIVADDLGYGDLGCYGSNLSVTPRLDQLAREGTRFTDYYVSQAVCSASRASLMTGCYANRVGLAGALNHTSPSGIHPQETLLPELLKQAGYATAMFGKWHLGLPPAFHPLQHGFDHWQGIPYSNDNSKYHPVLAAEMPPLPWYRDLRIAQTDPDQSQFTEIITQASVEFIESHRRKPFFLYVPYIMPHVPIFASKSFAGSTGKGLYADVLAELDHGVGQILDALEHSGLSKNTWVIFTSDNGPFLSYGSHAGSAGALREGKLTCFEGGVRVPCLMRWPDHVPAHRVNQNAWMTIDLLPTVCQQLQLPLPEQKIDGRDRSEILLDQPKANDLTHYAFYSGTELHAVRQGKWKLHLPHPYLTVNGTPGKHGKPAGFEQLKPQSIEQSGVNGIASRHGYRVEQQPLALYDLSNDAMERTDVSEEYPDQVKGLLKIAQAYRDDLGDTLVNHKGTGVRECGKQTSP